MTTAIAPAVVKVEQQLLQVLARGFAPFLTVLCGLRPDFSTIQTQDIIRFPAFLTTLSYHRAKKLMLMSLKEHLPDWFFSLYARLLKI